MKMTIGDFTNQLNIKSTLIEEQRTLIQNQAQELEQLKERLKEYQGKHAKAVTERAEFKVELEQLKALSSKMFRYEEMTAEEVNQLRELLGIEALNPKSDEKI